MASLRAQTIVGAIDIWVTVRKNAIGLWAVCCRKSQNPDRLFSRVCSRQRFRNGTTVIADVVMRVASLAEVMDVTNKQEMFSVSVNRANQSRQADGYNAYDRAEMGIDWDLKLLVSRFLLLPHRS